MFDQQKKLTVSSAEAKRILTRSSGFLTSVSSHSLNPYRGCTFGNALCGVGCYVQHNAWLTRNEPWGSFLEARTNAADSYRQHYAAEQRWARRRRGSFVIFMSSSTDPFVPQEDRFRITEGVLRVMIDNPPDALIIQTHTDRVTKYLDLYPALAARSALRFHISIESDRGRLPGLPPPANSVERRFAAAEKLHAAGLRVVITVSPLLPIERPEAFFTRIAAVADAVVIDHFIAGDGTYDGSRTWQTALPQAMAAVDSKTLTLDYRDRIVALARAIMPGRVGVNIDGFAGRFLP